GRRERNNRDNWKSFVGDPAWPHEKSLSSSLPVWAQPASASLLGAFRANTGHAGDAIARQWLLTSQAGMRGVLLPLAGRTTQWRGTISGFESSSLCGSGSR